MSNEITRFNHVTDWGIERDADGDYVLHSDHEAEVARLHDLIDDKDEIIARQDRLLVERQGSNDRLRAEVEKVRGYEVAALEEKVAELRAELQNAAKAALDATALACEKEREADALREKCDELSMLHVAVIQDKSHLEIKYRNSCARADAKNNGQKLVGYRWRHSAGEKWQYSDIPCGWEYEPLYAAMGEGK
ncbi:hypothetical protein [Stenotrophomonas indicatrix]|uniref:hypothetical protein n=1 Tax=Stenotrophomonas indicatrix TaxID=2045451 RepID=UPI0008D65C41|nr:hypothetical protein [Stenotrophomonas indicatrix]SEU13100.1 hypothetical protein SAMN05720615_11858 [Stenotrophomonas indicatrix]